MPFPSMTGLTLIELLVALSVALILISIAVPGFQGAVATNRIAGLTNELTAAFNLARSEAVSRGTTVTICRSSTIAASAPTCSTASDVGWQNGWLIFVDAGTQGTVDGSDTRLRVGQPSANTASIDGGGQLDDATDGNFDLYLTYLPSGVTQGNNGEAGGAFTIRTTPNSGATRRILIASTGRVRVCEPDPTNQNDPCQ